MRVAVVGAGLAGIAAARELVASGHEVVVFEKSRGLGGRLASRRADGGAVLDHGSPVIAAPAGSALRALIEATPAEDRVDLPDGVAYAAGATRLPKILAAGLDVRFGVRLAALRAAGAGLELGDEQGNTHGVAGAVVVTAPAPQAADLLARSPEPPERVAALRALAYAPAVMVLAGVALAPGAVIGPVAGGPLASVRRETAKGRADADGVAPLVARLDAAASARLLDASDEEALALALPALAAVLGPGAPAPAWAQVKRWRYAVPEGRLDEEAVNPPGSRVIIAGDTVTGARFGGDDHHRVFDSGVRAARRVASIPTAEAVR
ncbi:FAD-dependent oxidoreductase [Miltoncostaea oceani]|uniref:FAD-dependent oxidoreductase n=1 Tax=Miltoncostaea oceani TaxID=2843216 RepID=UPI00248480EA|nr:FAD-dependent oxidoreductase [Miltoncostaea oceani]